MPRCSISIPIEAALIPFPILERTPPVTKMYFFCFAMIGLPQSLFHKLQVLRRVDFYGDKINFSDPNRDSRLERAKLLKHFSLLDIRRRKRAEALEGLAGVNVKTHMPLAGERRAGTRERAT